MHVAVDGMVFEYQAHGGVSRIFHTIIPMMYEMDPQLSFSLYHARPLKQRLAPHPQVEIKGMLPLDARFFSFPKVGRYQRRNIALSLALPVDKRKQKNTIWHSTDFSQPVRWAGPKVVSVYDLILFFYPHYFPSRDHESLRKQMAEAIRTADVVLCISQTTANDVESYFGIASSKLKVVHLAASPVFRSLEDQLEGQKVKTIVPTAKPFLLYVGTRPIYKNFALLLDAYSRWPHRNEVDMVLVGDPWTALEQAEILAKGVMDKLHICSGLNDEQLNGVYNQALAFVYPSLYEGFGIPLLEAMAAGCPIVASDIPTSREVARDYPTYFDPSQVDSLVAALDTVWLSQPEPTHAFYGQQIAAEYNWEQTARKTLQEYYNVSGLTIPPSLFLPEPKPVV